MDPRNTVSLIDLREITARLKETLELCAELGLSDAVQTNRFLTYCRFLELTADFIHDDDPGIVDAWDRVLGHGQRVFPWWLTESAELGDIAPLIRAFRSKLFTYKLKRILGGPLTPSEEDPQSNLARNTLFELIIASRLWRHGIPITLSEQGDVHCRIRDSFVLIECKRSFALHTAISNIDQASSQLGPHIAAAPPGTRGVVAISLSRALLEPDGITEYLDSEAAAAATSTFLAETAEHVIANMRVPQMNIIGLLLHASVTALDRRRNTYSYGTGMYGHSLVPEHSRDRRIFAELCQTVDCIPRG